FRVYKKASPDAAIVEAAYRTLTHYFPTAAPTLDPLYATALAAIPNGQAKLAGQRIGWVAANQVIRARTGDGLQTPIASTLTFPTLTPGPGVYRRRPRSRHRRPRGPQTCAPSSSRAAPSSVPVRHRR